MEYSSLPFSHLLECPVCLKSLDERCRVLHCQHTLCLKCLSNCMVTRGYIQCPECRKEYPDRIPSSFPRNVLLMRLLESIKQEEARKLPAKNQARPRRLNSGCRRRKANSVTIRNEIDAFQHQACALALHSFRATEEGDLAFSRGDLLPLTQELDENWVEGVFKGRHGAMPKNFLDILVPVAKFDDDTIRLPLAKALYTCDANEDPELMTFKAGDVIHIIKRVDENWLEGILAFRYGIVAINFVQLNSAAKSLMATSESSSSGSSSEDDLDVRVDQSVLTRTTESLPPQDLAAISTEPSAAEASSSEVVASPWVLAEPPKRHTIHVESPNEHPPGRAAFDQSWPVPVRLGTRRASECASQEPYARSPSENASVHRSARSSAEWSDRRALRSSGEPTTAHRTSASLSAERLNHLPPANPGRSNAGSRRDLLSRSAVPGSNSAGEMYTAMFNYSPTQDDELALLFGDQYCVLEKLTDGWHRGYHVKSGQAGVFPGNYVKPSSHVVPLSRSLSANAAVSTTGCTCRSTPSSPAIHNDGAFSFAGDLAAALSRSDGEVSVVNSSVAIPSSARSSEEDASTRPSAMSGLLRILRKKKKKNVRPPFPVPIACNHRSVPCPSRPSPLLPSDPPPPYTPTDTHINPELDCQRAQLRSTSVRERFRAIAAFPAVNEQELPLAVGDDVIVTEKFASGWYRGFSQRLGRAGVFPSTFVQSF